MDLQFCERCGAVIGMDIGTGRVSRWETHNEWHENEDARERTFRALLNATAKPRPRRKSGE